MKTPRLKRLLFLALCCDMGLFAKRLISPATHIITDLLRLPDGIGTGFSLMFLVIAAEIAPCFGTAALMGVTQGLLALSLGMTGHMGALSVIGYIVPGVVIDIVVFISGRIPLSTGFRCISANMLSAAAAALICNLIVLHLPHSVLILYLLTVLISGAVCGYFACVLTARLKQTGLCTPLSS